MSYRVLLSKHAFAFLESADQPLQRKLARCFDALSRDPREGNNVKRLTGSQQGLWRYRVGSYRVIYQIQDDHVIVLVTRIAHRSNVYE